MSKHPKFDNYESASEYQLSEWVAGRPWHNPFTPDGKYGLRPQDGECCPDFSCCDPELLSPEHERKEFAAKIRRALSLKTGGNNDAS